MFFTVLRYILIALEVLTVFNLIIVVHELGHFLAARWRGLVVEEFGVWFGKPLWRKKFGDVWYSLGSVPFGGFVKLPQLGMRAVEGEAETDLSTVPPIRPLDKIIVAFAGPFFSFLLALALGTLVWAVGKPGSQPENTTEIGMVSPGGPADQAGLKTGDKIIAIDGHKVVRFMGALDSVMWNIMRSEGEKIDFLIERDGKQMNIQSGWVKEETPGWKRKSLRKVQIGPRFIPEVALVAKDGAGAKAGLQKGDIVTEANGTKIITLHQLGEVLQKNPDQPLNLVVERKDAKGQNPQALNFTIPPMGKPATEEDLPLGVEWGGFYLEHPTPWRQVTDSVRTMGNMVDALVSKKSDVKAQHFSGPVGIMNAYRRMFESEEGWRMAIVFSVFFNVNLAIINMLPLPILDGGHITLGILEAIRRKPLNVRAMEIMETACTMALLAFLLYVTFFDVGDLLPRFGRDKEPAAASATPAPTAAPAPK